jgi:hypothetical protein
MGDYVDRVHDAMNWWHSSGPQWIKGGVDRMCGGALPTQGTRDR